MPGLKSLISAWTSVADAARRPMNAADRIGLRAALSRAADVDDRLRAALLDGIEDGVGDVGEGLVPRDALPLPLAALADALHRIEDALLAVELLAPHAPFWQPMGFMSGTPASMVAKSPACSSRTTLPSRE